MKADIKHKNGHNLGRERPQESVFDQKLLTMSPEALGHPGGSQINENSGFKKFWGGHIRPIILLIGLPIKPWWIAPY